MTCAESRRAPSIEGWARNDIAARSTAWISPSRSSSSRSAEAAPRTSGNAPRPMATVALPVAIRPSQRSRIASRGMTSRRSGTCNGQLHRRKARATRSARAPPRPRRARYRPHRDHPRLRVRGCRVDRGHRASPSKAQGRAPSPFDHASRYVRAGVHSRFRSARALSRIASWSAVKANCTYYLGSPRTRSAITFRWISFVPA